MKKVIAMALCLVMILSLAACGQKPDGTQPAGSSNAPAGSTPAATQSPLAGTYDIKVWAPEAAVALTTKQIDDFNKSNPDGIVFNAKIEAQGEGEAASQMIQDVDAGGDLFFFPQDQFARLITAGCLSQLGKAAGQIVREANDAGAVGAASVGEDLYAYPMTADNSYFLYYDKSVIDEASIGSMEALIAACEKANKYFAFDLGNVWYSASFFFGAGCVSEWTTDADGAYTAVNDTFDTDLGLIAAKGMKTLLNSPIQLNSSSAAEFSKGAAVLIDGPWDFVNVQNILGDNLGAAKLPTYTVDGKEYQLSPYGGYKLLGVKPTTDPARSASLHKLAQYLTSKDAQLERFNELAWGPANVEAQKDPAVLANPGLTAIAAQGAFTTVQGNIPPAWWAVGNAISAGVKDAADEAALRAVITNYGAQVKDILNINTEGFVLVGAWNGWDNVDDANNFHMELVDGNYVFTLTVEQSDYMGGRIVTPGSWDTDKGCLIVTDGADLLTMVGDPGNGDNNIVFKEPGTYHISFNKSANVITIEKK